MLLEKSFFNHDAQAGGFFPKTHVGIDISQIGKRQNTLLEGIRGAGKTHILKMLSSYLLEHFEDNRVLPVYVSVAQLSEHAKKDPDEFRLQLYAHLVKACIETIKKAKYQLQSDKSLLEKSIEYIKRMFQADDKNTDINTLIEKIDSTAERLLFELQYNLESKSFKEEKAVNSKVGTNLSYGAKPFKAEAHSEIQHSKNDQESVMYMGRKLAHNNAVDFLVEFLKQLQVILDLDYSLLLIDECSEASSQAQVEIFRLFKAIRSANSYLPEDNSNSVFFVGAVYPKAETYYPTREKDGFSFEQGHDCTTDFLQWDETDQEGYVGFFKQMLHNRAKELISYQLSADDLIKELFDRRDTFLLSIYAAHGIPRRFWELTRRAYDNNQITHNRMIHSIQEIAQKQLLETEYLSDQDRSFIYWMAHRLQGQNGDIRGDNHKRRRNIPQNIYFVADRNVSNNFKKLMMQGTIHDKSKMRTKLKGNPKPLYALDLSVAYSLKVIPDAVFANFLENELFRCASTNYENALTVTEKTYKDSLDNNLAVEEIQSSQNQPKEPNEDLKEDSITYGSIKEYNGLTGFIQADDKEADALFQKNSIDQSCSENLSINDRIEFVNHWMPDGSRYATNIRKINTIQSNGIIKRFEQKDFGTIEIKDGGPDAYFIPKDINESFELGDYVEFVLEETGKGRRAYNITKLEPKACLEEETREQLKEYIEHLLETSDANLSLASLAFQIKNMFGDIVSINQWFGYKKFRNLLDALKLDDLIIDTSIPPGYIYKNITLQEPDVVPIKNQSLIDKLSNLIGIPDLSPNEYSEIFDILSEHTQQYGYQFAETSKAVRDKCKAKGINISRININSILRGIYYTGHRFSKQDTSNMLHTKFIENVNKLIERHSILLNSQEKEQLNMLFG